jgi:hypothetical protein
MKTNCIVCNTEVDNWDDAYPEGKIQVHPIGGTVFLTYGHYGSSVFDPMDASYLEVVVCDDCLKTRTERTYTGVNEQYRQELDDRRAEMDILIDAMLKEDENE